MAGWNPIATTPREVGRPLLLYPRPRPVYEQQSEGPLLDLTDPAVKRMIRLAKTRGYVTSDELNAVLPPEEFTREQIEDVLGQLYEMGITVVEAEEDEESLPAAAAEGQGKSAENSQLAALAIYISVFEGCWDGRGWRTSIGRPCKPTHWMPMPSPPRQIGRRPLPVWVGETGASSWAQFILKFIVSHPAVTCAIPATTRVDHVRENMAAAAGTLPDEALRRRMATYVQEL
jgi:hypothetical protein